MSCITTTCSIIKAVLFRPFNDYSNNQGCGVIKKLKILKPKALAPETTWKDGRDHGCKYKWRRESTETACSLKRLALTLTGSKKPLTIDAGPKACTHPVAAATGKLIANPQANPVVCKRQETFYRTLLLRLERTFRRKVRAGFQWVQPVCKHFKIGAILCRESSVPWSYGSAFRGDTLSKNILLFKEEKHAQWKKVLCRWFRFIQVH